MLLIQYYHNDIETSKSYDGNIIIRSTLYHYHKLYQMLSKMFQFCNNF